MGEVCVQLRVIQGAQLPKMGFFEEMSGFVRVYVNDKQVGETRAVTKCPDPIWDEALCFETEQDDYYVLLGLLRFELYQSHSKGDPELVGTVEIQLDSLDPDSIYEPMDLAVAFMDDKKGQKYAKQGRDTTLRVAIEGIMDSFATLADSCLDTEGVIVDKSTRQVLAPVPETGGTLYAGVAYKDDGVEYRVYSTAKDQETLHLDWKAPSSSVASTSYSTPPTNTGLFDTQRGLRCRRLVRQQKERVAKGLKALQEASLVGIMPGTPLKKVKLQATRKRATASKPVTDIINAAGFPGPNVSFKKAAKEMSSASSAMLVDNTNACLCLPVGKRPFSVLVVLDYGGQPEGKDPTLRLASIKAKDGSVGGVANDEVVWHGLYNPDQDTSLVSETYKQSIKLLDGELKVSRMLELPGGFSSGGGEAVLQGCSLVFYSLDQSDLMEWSLEEILHPPPPTPPPDHGSFADFDPDHIPTSMASVAEMVAVKGGSLAGKMVGTASKAVGSLAGNIGKLAVSAGDKMSTGARAVGSGVVDVFKKPLGVFRKSDEYVDEEVEEEPVPPPTKAQQYAAIKNKYGGGGGGGGGGSSGKSSGGAGSYRAGVGGGGSAAGAASMGSSKHKQPVMKRHDEDHDEDDGGEDDYDDYDDDDDDEDSGYGMRR